MLDERGRPLPKWRANIRRRFAERGYDIDWNKLEKARKRAAFNLFILAAILGVLALICFAVAWIASILGYR